MQPASRPVQATCPVSLVYQNREAVCEIALGEDWQVMLHDDLLQTLNQHFERERYYGRLLKTWRGG
jgi:hypothetical protein